MHLVTGEAANLSFAVKALLINSNVHGDHFAGRHFFFLVVAIELALHVAELAVFAQRVGEIVHGVDGAAASASCRPKTPQRVALARPGSKRRRVSPCSPRAWNAAHGVV